MGGWWFFRFGPRDRPESPAARTNGPTLPAQRQFPNIHYSPDSGRPEQFRGRFTAEDTEKEKST
jgi:hypothetical protein